MDHESRATIEPLPGPGGTREEARALRELLDLCGDAAVITDLGARVRYANRAFLALLDALPADARVDAMRPLMLPEILAAHVTERQALAESLVALYSHPERAGGGRCTFQGTGARVYTWRSLPVHGATGTVSGRCFTFHGGGPELEVAGLQRDVLSTVTHELRTPLASVRGSLQLVLEKSSALSTVERELLNISVKNADRLIRLINNILDLSWIELGRTELTFADIPSAALVEETIAGLRSYATERNVAIQCEISPDLPGIRGDRDRIIQVLTNLLSNAVKFSAPGGLVLVRAALNGHGVAIAVRDWGIGIHAQDQPRLFQRFQRLGRANGGEPGTGLGLAISKAIVDRHGGRILVESGEGAGSTFTLCLPVANGGPGRDRRPTPRATVASGERRVQPGRGEPRSSGGRGPAMPFARRSS